MSNLQSYARQSGLFDPTKQQAHVEVIGAGSVGSFTTLALAKIGIKDITSWDNDFIDNHNIPNQFYRLGEVGKPKVTALASTIKEYENIDITAKHMRYNGQDLKGIVVSAVDSMDARRFIWDCVKSEPVDHYIDTRMGGNLMKIYSLSPKDKKRGKEYEKALGGKKELPLRCSERTILYNVLSLAGMSSCLVTKAIKGEETPFESIFDMKTWGFICSYE